MSSIDRADANAAVSAICLSETDMLAPAAGRNGQWLLSEPSVAFCADSAPGRIRIPLLAAQANVMP